MFRNLIENAVRYSPDGGAVEVRSSREDDAIIVEVSDEGPGVPPIARDIARLHGGDLTLAEKTGPGGATFVVRLPLAVDG
jgi:signal transduction histidine kinase